MMKHCVTLLICAGSLLLPACHGPEIPEEKEEPLQLQGFQVGVDTLFLKEGEGVSVPWAATPEELTSQVRLLWESADESLLQVDESGKVTALDYGVTSLAVTASYTDATYAVKKISREIPVFISLSDTPISNPEQMYAYWLGRWDLYAPVYTNELSYWGQNPNDPDYYADYVITIREQEPMKTYSLSGWSQFQGSSVTGSSFPGKPLELIARFDSRSGRLAFIRNKAANFDEAIFQTAFWTTRPQSRIGSPQRYGMPEDMDIGYARQVNEKEAIIRGVYNRIAPLWYYHVGMGFTNSSGETIDKPMSFPIQMTRMKERPVTQVTLSKNALEMEVGDEEVLTVKWRPDDASGFTIQWASSCPEVVSVEEGRLQALSPGQADVIVTLGEVSDTCQVLVRKPYIHFASQQIRNALCALWDADGDGELCVEEAEAATYLGRLSNIYGWEGAVSAASRFHELKYFTSVQELDPYFLAGVDLQEITIPANIRTIGAHALDFNSMLTHVFLLGTPPQIGEQSLGFVLEYYSRLYLWVPDEYYDLYIEEAQKEGSPWAIYLPRIFRVSSRSSGGY